MKTGQVSIRAGGELDRVGLAVRRLAEAREGGAPNLQSLWEAHGGEEAVTVLAALVKADLAHRFSRGEHPEVTEYLERFPALCGQGECVLSLIYEEYCLREERGERPDTEEFCQRYAPWKDSLESQLKYHRVISQVVGPSSEPPKYPKAGDRFGEFEIGEEIGRGSAGRVYLAQDHSMGARVVVLKVSLDRGNEPSILGQLDHAHIVSALTVVRPPESKLRGLVMPYRPGLALDEVIRKLSPDSCPKSARALKGALGSPADSSPEAHAGEPRGRGWWDTFPDRGTYADGVAAIGVTLAEALEYAHNRKIFHRDVKPANILLTHKDGPQLLDFNLSHDPHDAGNAEAALRGGTLPYMAPEQLSAFLDPKMWDSVREPADVYALGLVLCELLTGQAPVTQDPTLPLPRAIADLHLRRADLHPERLRGMPGVPRALQAIVGRCLAFDPADRYPRAGELAEDLRRFLARRPLSYAVNPSKHERAVNWSYRNRIALTTAVVAAAIVASFALKKNVPVEESPVFLKAVWALDHGNPAEALKLISELGSLGNDSSVFRFYTSIALAQSQRPKDACDELARAAALPGMVKELSRWGQEHPEFVQLADDLSESILTPDIMNDKQRCEDMTRHAVPVLRVALRLDPKRVNAFYRLAVVEENAGHFEVAHQNLIEAIAGAGVSSPADRYRLMMFLRSRGRVATSWAQSLQRDKTPGDDAPRAPGLFTSALTDLDRVDDLLAAMDISPDKVLEARYKTDYIRCEATLGLALLEKMRGASTESDRLSREARRILDRLKNPGGPDEPEFHRLRKKVLDQTREAAPEPRPARPGRPL